MKDDQSGFTLIELSIVLTAVGLLLGCLFKVQELNNIAKVKRLTSDFRNIPVLISAYVDKFHALPGDDAMLADHLGATATACAPEAAGKCAAGTGVIDGDWRDTTAASESFVFWQHLRLAGLADGSTDTSQGVAYLPTNAVDGMIGVQGNRGFTTITENAVGKSSPMTTSYIICSKGILGKYVEQLDIAIDDGNPDTGLMRAADPTDNGRSVTLAAVNGNPGQVYTVCMGA